MFCNMFILRKPLRKPLHKTAHIKGLVRLEKIDNLCFRK